MFKKNSCCLTVVSLYFSGDILKGHLYDLGSKVIQNVVACSFLLGDSNSCFQEQSKSLSVAFKKFSFLWYC